jgi:hypothetical protein
MDLFRGDKIHNIDTCPGIYRGNGLRTKSFGSGCNPKNIELLGLIESIRKHIKPLAQKDFDYYDVTDFLSFSSKRQRAMYWCADRNALILDKSEEYEETRYLFTLNLNNNLMTSIRDGIYIYRYQCNLGLIKPDKKNDILTSIFKYKSINEPCPICGNMYNNHRLVLINSFEYLIKNTKDAKYKEAIELAKDDDEWLVLPFDSLGELRSSRIQRADFWFAEHYKVIGETRPDIDHLKQCYVDRHKNKHRT